MHLSRFEPPEFKLHPLFSAWVLYSFLDYTDSSVRSVNVNVAHEISGFRLRVDEVFALLVCFAPFVDGFPTFWDSISVLSYKGHLKTVPIGCPETSVNSELTRLNNPKERRRREHNHFLNLVSIPFVLRSWCIKKNYYARMFSSRPVGRP